MISTYLNYFVLTELHLLLELVWRRARKGPRLLPHHRRQRLEWCLANRYNTFWNYIFADETSCWINTCPFYHWRHPATHPEVVSAKVERLKINVWGAISAMGASEFVVIKIEIRKNK